MERMCIIKGVALSDIHLGYRAYPATTEGRNTRECDVETAWWAAVDLIVERKPDLVTIAGDIFHHPRVGVHALKAWRDGLRKIIEYTGARVVVAMGNHDAGKTADVLTPIILPDDLPSVSIVTTPLRIMLDIKGKPVSVAVFPFVIRGNGETYKLNPSPEADTNVLVMHAAVRGSAEGDKLPWFYGSSDQALDVGREADRWDAILLGDWHDFAQLHPDRSVFYSGSLERTSNNIWQETAPKGVVEYDTDKPGELVFHEIPTRPMFDYDFSGSGKYPLEPCAENINLALLQMLAGEEHRDAIVRLKIEDFPREDREHIDWGHVRELKSLTTHFYMDLRYAKRELIDLGDRRERPVATLADEAVAFFSDDEQPVRDCAMRYLDFEAEAVA